MRLRLVQSPADTGGRVLEWEATYRPGSPEPPQHLHPKQHEHFTVLAGRFRVRLGDKLRTLEVGEELEIPAGTAHSMWNEAAEDGRLLWRVEPALQTQELFTTLFALARQGRTDARGAPNLLQLAVIGAAYREEIRYARPHPLVQRLVFGVLAPIARLLGYRTRVE